MPYPESCPECGSQFRNTGTHFTARRNEVGRHVLLELGCQNTRRRYWWDFTAGHLAEDESRSATMLVGAAAVSSNGSGHTAIHGTSHAPMNSNGHEADNGNGHEPANGNGHAAGSGNSQVPPSELPTIAELAPAPTLPVPEVPVTAPAELSPAEAAPSLREAFVRQLHLDRMTLRQMRSLFMADDARRAIEVAVGATEATYERLAVILFGTELAQLLGKPAAASSAPSISAEERLELQREKARIRARLRRAAIKAAKQPQ
jgi:hypothetical protein